MRQSTGQQSDAESRPTCWQRPLTPTALTQPKPQLLSVATQVLEKQSSWGFLVIRGTQSWMIWGLTSNSECKRAQTWPDNRIKCALALLFVVSNKGLILNQLPVLNHTSQYQLSTNSRTYHSSRVSAICKLKHEIVLGLWSDLWLLPRILSKVSSIWNRSD